MEGTGGEVELFHGRFQQFPGWFFRLAKLSDLGRGHFGVAGQRRAGEPVSLPGTGGLDPVLNGGRRFTQPVIGQFFIVDMRHFDEDVDAVDKRAADAVLVAGDQSGGAGALPERVAVVAAGTGIRCSF